MRDLFDDFMDELRKREAAAHGEDPGPDRRRDEAATNPDDVDDDPSADADGEPAADVDADADTDTDVDADGPGENDTFTRPHSIDDRRGGGGRPPRRPPGGPDDGAPGGAGRTGRRLGLYAIVLAELALTILIFYAFTRAFS